ncbi:MAG: hypothetical protein QNI91_08670 [Arenicellales bacterium]|nr:hypothetical protein [Arenicellales bacterium]
MTVNQNGQPLWHRVLNAFPDIASRNRFISSGEGVVYAESGMQCPSSEILFDGDSQECEVISLYSDGDPDFDGNPDAAILLCLDLSSRVDLVIGVGGNWVAQNCRENITDGPYAITVVRERPPNAGDRFLFKFTLSTSENSANKTLTLSNVSVTGPL